jgi:hypothetical protein
VKPNIHSGTNDASTDTGQRETGDHRRAPGIQEQEDDEDGEQRAFDERLFDVAHGTSHALTGVSHYLDVRAGR